MPPVPLDRDGLLAALRVSLRHKAPPTDALLRQVIDFLQGEFICKKCGIRQPDLYPKDISF